jgi:hypothetical protein
MIYSSDLRQWIIRKLSNKDSGTLENDVIRETELLERDIINRELDRINIEYKLKAQRAKHNYLIQWLSRDVPTRIYHGNEFDFKSPTEDS